MEGRQGMDHADGSALWAGKGSGRADRGKKVLGYGSGLAAAGSCSVLAGNIGSAPASRSGTAG
jgi:hypothetical protein